MMIQLSPAPNVSIECTKCNRHFPATDWAITGIHNMCYGECPQCHTQYYKEMPVNAGLFYPGIIDAITGKRTDSLPYDNWYLAGLEHAYTKKRSKEPVNITVEKNRPLTRKKVALLNTIDHCYGHCLFELFNASYYLKQPDVDLIIIIQKNLRWLVPDGAAEVWVVDLGFAKAEGWFDSLAADIKQKTKDIPNLYLCMSFVQTDGKLFSKTQHGQ